MKDKNREDVALSRFGVDRADEPSIEALFDDPAALEAAELAAYREEAGDRETAGGLTQRRTWDMYSDAVRATPASPSEEEVLTLIRIAQDSSLQNAERISARNRVVEQHLRMVLSEAGKLGVTRPEAGAVTSGGLDANDLIQVGNLALIAAVDSYDVTRGTRFMSWVSYKVRGAIQGARAADGTAVGIPGYVQKAARLIAELRSQLAPISDADLLAEINKDPISVGLYRPISAQRLDEIAASGEAHVTSLNERVAEGDDCGGDLTLEDMLSSDVFPTPDEALQRDQLRTRLMARLQEVLTPRELRIIDLRYGLMDDDDLPMTMREVATAVGGSPATVMRSERSALEKMRNDAETLALYLSYIE